MHTMVMFTIVGIMYVDSMYWVDLIINKKFKNCHMQ